MSENLVNIAIGFVVFCVAWIGYFLWRTFKDWDREDVIGLLIIVGIVAAAWIAGWILLFAWRLHEWIQH